MARPFLFTPGGHAIRRMESEAMRPEDGDTIKDFHRVAQRYDVGLHCSRCGEDFQGTNSGTEKYYVIRCKCRELKWEPKNRF